MKEHVLLVVGDKFAQFCANRDVMRLSQLRGLLTLPSVVPLEARRLVLLPGQGLGDADIAEVLRLAASSPHRALFDLGLWHQHPRRAPRSQSHKHKPENTLISEPRRIEEDVYELDLLIDENCELMADHQTGQHVQGMILMEAARQSFLAVTEAFFLPDGAAFYFVINEMTARYARFAFPLDARIRYTIRSRELSARRRHFVADIAVEQCGANTASFVTDFTVFEDARISSREAVLAAEAVDQHLAAFHERRNAGDRLAAVA